MPNVIFPTSYWYTHCAAQNWFLANESEKICSNAWKLECLLFATVVEREN